MCVLFLTSVTNSNIDIQFENNYDESITKAIITLIDYFNHVPPLVMILLLWFGGLASCFCCVLLQLVSPLILKRCHCSPPKKVPPPSSSIHVDMTR